MTSRVPSDYKSRVRGAPIMVVKSALKRCKSVEVRQRYLQNMRKQELESSLRYQKAFLIYQKERRSGPQRFRLKKTKTKIVLELCHPDHKRHNPSPLSVPQFFFKRKKNINRQCTQRLKRQLGSVSVHGGG